MITLYDISGFVALFLAIMFIALFLFFGSEFFKKKEVEQ